MDEAHRLLERLADRDLRAHVLVVHLEDLEADERVEGAVERDDGLEGHGPRHLTWRPWRGLLGVVADERVHVVRREQLAAAEEARAR